MQVISVNIVKKVNTFTVFTIANFAKSKQKDGLHNKYLQKAIDK